MSVGYVVFLLFFCFLLYIIKRERKQEIKRIHMFPSTCRQNEVLRRKAKVAFTTQKRRFQNQHKGQLLGNCVVSNPTTPLPFCLSNSTLLPFSLIRAVSIFSSKLGCNYNPTTFLLSLSINHTRKKKPPTRNQLAFPLCLSYYWYMVWLVFCQFKRVCGAFEDETLFLIMTQFLSLAKDLSLPLHKYKPLSFPFNSLTLFLSRSLALPPRPALPPSTLFQL